MNANPFLGVVFHWLGGLAAGSFYVPYRRVKGWSWEVYWLVGGIFSWIIAPWALAAVKTTGVVAVIQEAPASSLLWSFFWGLMWGIGGLTFGLTMRYLGVSLGYAVALGYCAAFGTLLPPLVGGEFGTKILGTLSGNVVLGGVALCLGGIALAGWAGRSKEKEMGEEEKTSVITEFSFRKGILVATFSGVLSASMAYGLDAAQPLAEIALKHGTPLLWSGLPKLCIVLLGGFTTNAIWCLILNARNRTGREYFSRDFPLLRNYGFSILAGTVWYLQFFFYSMGETQMGEYRFSSWTIHMASIIIFSSLWGVALKEWKGSSHSTKRLLAFGLLLLVVSTVIIGYGNALHAAPPAGG